MALEVEYTDEFNTWWESLDGDEQESVYAAVILLEILGPNLRYPHSSSVEGPPAMATCERYGSSTVGAPIGCSTRSTPGVSPSS